MVNNFKDGETDANEPSNQASKFSKFNASAPQLKFSSGNYDQG